MTQDIKSHVIGCYLVWLKYENSIYLTKYDISKDNILIIARFNSHIQLS